MRYLTVIFIFIVCLISVLAIIGMEYFIDNIFLVPLVESLVIFIAVLLLLKITGKNYFFIVFLFSFFFVLLETGVYAICEELGFSNFGMKEIISWRLLYNSIFTFIYVPILCFGLKYKDKILWILYFVVGFIFHLGFNLVMEVVS